MLCRFASPLGVITLREREGFLVSLSFTPDVPLLPPESPLLIRAREQLLGYFAGNRRVFSLPLCPEGTAFQQAVWQQLMRIPYGETCSYGQLAAAIGKPGAVRAVGNANGKNPLPILIPCHRVIAADGGLGGYSCGLKKKAFLLALERPPEGGE